MWQKHRTSIILTAVFLILFSGFWFFPSFAFIFFISVLMKLLLNPVVDKLEQRLHRIPAARGIASAISVFCTLLIIFGGGIIVTQSFIPTLQKFINDLPQFALQLQEMTISYSGPYFNTDMTELWNELSNMGMSALKNSVTLLLSMFSKLIDFVIIIFVTFYLLKDGKSIQIYLANLFPSKSNSRIMLLFDNIQLSLQTYIRSQLTMCAITGIVVFAYFSYYDMDYASVFAVVSGIGEFVPVLGPTLGALLGITLTATQAPYMAIQTSLFYLILTQINHNIIYPTLIGKTLKLHPVAIILGVVFGGELLDAAGMFLAVPCIVVFKHLIEDIHAHQESD